MLDIITHGAITELRMNRPPANALNHELLGAILAGYAAALEGGARALILSGRPGMFCAGVDVPELLGQSRDEIHRFWSLLFQTSKSLAACPVPVVASVGGHSPAGGAVLAAHCDYRIAADGRYKIGFNEVQVGLPLPTTIQRVFEELVGTRLARQLGMQGVLLTMDRARDIGLVDELVSPDALDARVLAFVQGLLALPSKAMNGTRLAGKSRLIRALDEAGDVERTTAAWFSEETQAALGRLVDSLSGNNK